MCPAAIHDPPRPPGECGGLNRAGHDAYGGPASRKTGSAEISLGQAMFAGELIPTRRTFAPGILSAARLKESPLRIVAPLGFLRGFIGPGKPSDPQSSRKDQKTTAA